MPSNVSDIITLPAYSDRKHAASLMNAEFPKHNDTIRVGTSEAERLTSALLAKRSEYRKLALEIAQLESEVKRKIGLFRGLRVKSGTWFWDKTRAHRKIDWPSIAQDLKISARIIDEHTKTVDGPRYLRFERSKDPIWPTNTTITPKETSSASENLPKPG